MGEKWISRKLKGYHHQDGDGSNIEILKEEKLIRQQNGKLIMKECILKQKKDGKPSLYGKYFDDT